MQSKFPISNFTHPSAGRRVNTIGQTDNHDETPGAFVKAAEDT
jgi:hypothetical protein